MWTAFNVVLKEQFYPVGYDEERWRRWLYLRQRSDQGVQDYTTECRRRALVLGVPLDDKEVLRKYLAGLQEELREEVDLYPIMDIGDACKKAMVFEKLNRACGRGKGKQSASMGKDKGKGKGKAKAEASVASEGDGDVASKKGSKKGSYHCGKEGHTKSKCWKLHPELAPKRNGMGGSNGKTLVTAVGEGTMLQLIEEEDPTLSLMVRKVQDGWEHEEVHGEAAPQSPRAKSLLDQA